MALDLFGQEIIEDVLLRDKFMENPFTVIDTKGGNYANRKRAWIAKGLKSDIGRDAKAFNIKDWADNNSEVGTIPGNTSIFNPAVAEVLYHWFCDNGGEILDPFAGGSVRGIVANYLGYKYTGIDIRQEQVDSNREQALEILPVENQPQWYVGDSNEVLNGFNKQFDFVFSCPPYADLEVYSDLPGDISNKPYDKFLKAYQSIIKKSCMLLKSGCYACFVVGEIRDKKGNYYGFVPDTINAFKNCGMNYYNEAILLNNIVTAQLRANGNMKTEKLVKVHQNVLVFKKP
jgi:DNA modification methylase